MNPTSLRGEIPVHAAASAARFRAGNRILALALLLVSVLILLMARTVAAQEEPANEPVTNVRPGPFERAAPRTRPVLTHTQRATEGEDADDAVTEATKAATSSDDFDNSSPTNWWTSTGLTVAAVNALIKSDDARLIDIEVDGFAPYSFTVTAVENAGAFKKTSAWFYGKTAAQVSALLVGNKVRLISLKAYDTGAGKIEFAGVTIANTGADLKTSTWYYDKAAADLTTLAKANPLKRFIAIDSYKDAGAAKYTAIMISNSGTGAVKSFWAADTPAANVTTLVKVNSARVTYISAAPGGKFNAVLEACTGICPTWQWTVTQSFSQLEGIAYQAGERLLDVSSYPSAACGGTLCFTGAMLNASSAIATRVGNLIRSGGLKGVEGLYLEQVSGPGTLGVLANLEDWVKYEPASSIKVLANLYAMTQVQAGKISLTTQIPHNFDGPESCPSLNDFSGTEPLGVALREMMWHSDNARTLEITNYFGDAKINAYAQKIGLKNTGFHEIVGCTAGGPDTLTLDDAGALYAGVANQVFLNAKDRGIFYSDMAGRAQYESENYDWTHVWDSDIPAIAKQVAPAGTTPTQISDYVALMNTAYKAGNYVLCQVNCPTPGVYPVIEDVAISGWFQLPFCTANGTTYAEYVWGIMFSNEPDPKFDLSNPKYQSQTDKNFFAYKSELMREQIAAGMASCKGKSLKVVTYSPASLNFGSVTVGTSATPQTVTITNNQGVSATGVSVSVFGDFTITGGCPGALLIGKSCTISVGFKPTATGERTGAVIVTDNGTGQPQTIELTGTGS